MQSLIYKCKLKLKLTNPFKIKDQYKQLSNKIPFTTNLLSKEQVNQTTYLMRFTLPDQDKCLGTEIGQYISLQDPKYDSQTVKYYCPISRIDDVGIFDILIKEIDSKEQNFSKHLASLNIGHSLNVSGPFNNFIYHGFGKLEHKNQVYHKKQIGLIAEKTGITAFFQLIEGIATNGDDTHIGLYYVADTLDELIFLEELCWLMEEKKLKVTFHLRNEIQTIQNLFPGPKGPILELDNHLPPASDDSLMMICGSSAFKKEVKMKLESMQHKCILII